VLAYHVNNNDHVNIATSTSASRLPSRTLDESSTNKPSLIEHIHIPKSIQTYHSSNHRPNQLDRVDTRRLQPRRISLATDTKSIKQSPNSKTPMLISRKRVDRGSIQNENGLLSPDLTDPWAFQRVKHDESQSRRWIKVVGPCVVNWTCSVT
jgi:hypothetical protein